MNMCNTQSGLTLCQTIPDFHDPGQEPAFSPFPTMFSNLSQTEIIILATVIVCNCIQFGQGQNFIIIPPQNKCFWGYTGISLSVRPSVYPSLCPSVYRNSFHRSADGGIKSHLVTALV